MQDRRGHRDTQREVTHLPTKERQGLQEPPEAGINKDPPPEPLEGTGPCRHLDCGPLASRTEPNNSPSPRSEKPSPPTPPQPTCKVLITDAGGRNSRGLSPSLAVAGFQLTSPPPPHPTLRNQPAACACPQPPG
nr:protein tonB2-like [Desmodus rotundus]